MAAFSNWDEKTSVSSNSLKQLMKIICLISGGTNLKPRGSMFEDIGSDTLFEVLKELWNSASMSLVLEVIVSDTAEDKVRLPGGLVMFFVAMSSDCAVFSLGVAIQVVRGC